MGNLQRKSTSHTSQVLEDMLYDQKYHKIDRERKITTERFYRLCFTFSDTFSSLDISDLVKSLSSESENYEFDFILTPLTSQTRVHCKLTCLELIICSILFLLRWLYPSERRLSAFNTVARKAFVNSDYACHFLNAPPVLSYQKDRIIG